jgi:DNA repair exonuclease SbcCD ATPase subunit
MCETKITIDMKSQFRNIALLTALSLSFFSCNTEELENKVSQLDQENQQLEAQYQAKDSSLTVFIKVFAEIEQNLREIREREMNIELAREENLSVGDLKNRVNENVQEINHLLEENRQKIKALNSRLTDAGRHNNQLKASMEDLQQTLTAKVEEKESQISSLEEDLTGLQLELNQLHTNLTQLKEENQEKEQLIHEKTLHMNKAFYTAGTFRELQDEQILSKEGGFLGLGRTEVLNENVDSERFNQIDIRETLFFPVDGEEVKLVTHHPDGSYRIEKNDEAQTQLVVSNPEKFWKSSRYLVMMVK